MDYSGFDRDTFVLRSGTEHRTLSLNTLSAQTQTERDKLEASTGCRYTVLSCLPYFDAPRMLVVDPMHNLFLGSAKHYVKSIFMKKGILSDDNFTNIQERINSFLVPADVGRIPHKISTGFASFTADQWKNWTLYFSMIVLRNHLSSDIYHCWQLFVLACRVLSCKVISVEQLKLGDALSAEERKDYLVQLALRPICTCIATSLRAWKIMGPCMVFGSMLLKDTMALWVQCLTTINQSKYNS
jgi:hypothetical protein